MTESGSLTWTADVLDTAADVIVRCGFDLTDTLTYLRALADEYRKEPTT